MLRIKVQSVYQEQTQLHASIGPNPVFNSLLQPQDQHQVAQSLRMISRYRSSPIAEELCQHDAAISRGPETSRPYPQRSRTDWKKQTWSV
jgi:hypothetical protein